jgi:UDP:flavonoid glycosyltransferase YjiC (YdhE family)
MLFTSAAGHGHIAPMLPLAQAALRGGHDVMFATGPGAVPEIEAAGLAHVTVGQSGADAPAVYHSTYPPESLADLSATERLVHLFVHLLVERLAPAMAADLVPFAQQWQPDLVVSNPTAVAGKLAAVTGAAHVQHGFSAPAPGPAIPAIQVAYEALFSDWGVGDAVATSYAQEPYLSIWPTGLNGEVADFLHSDMWPLRPENVVPLAAAGPKPDVLEGLPYERTAYVTIGTTFNKTSAELERVVAALAGEGVNLVATTGVDGAPERFGTQPPHVRVERFVPQRLLLPHCDVVVCHGGAGSVLGALAHGVPLVMFPLAADHHIIAAQVEAAGAGLVCSPVPSATGTRVPPGDAQAELVAAFRLALGDPTFKDNARRVGREIISMPPPSDVVGLLEAYVARGRP